MIEKNLGNIPEKKDYRNEDIIRKIFESGAPEELKEVEALHNLTPRQVELFCYYAKLRRITIDQMREEIKIREKENPVATEEELSMGVYKEKIEPQVMDTVLKLRQKGYTTFASGFSGFNEQDIKFNEEHLKDFQLPENLINDLEEKGVEIKIKQKSISFRCSSILKLDEIKKIWEDIESALPYLGEKAEPNNTNSAKSFLEKQKKIKNL